VFAVFAASRDLQTGRDPGCNNSVNRLPPLHPCHICYHGLGPAAQGQQTPNNAEWSLVTRSPTRPNTVPTRSVDQSLSSFEFLGPSARVLNPANIRTLKGPDRMLLDLSSSTDMALSATLDGPMRVDRGLRGGMFLTMCLHSVQHG
jgi:hypothetical protein